MQDRTLFLYNEFEGLVKFFILEGNYSHLDDVLLNEAVEDAEDIKLQDELNTILFESDGKLKVTLLDKFPLGENFNHVVNVGFIP
jgi:hypothetical protein